MNNELNYDGAFYAEVGDFIKEKYLEYIEIMMVEKKEVTP
jgi:hypothetical protein